MKRLFTRVIALAAAALLISCGGGEPAAGGGMPNPQSAQGRTADLFGVSRSPQRALTYTLTASQVMDWAEVVYSGLFSPSGAANVTASPYTYRYYSTTNSYLGVVTEAGGGATVGDIYVWHPALFGGALTRVGSRAWAT
jgi:hypothetical protein